MADYSINAVTRRVVYTGSAGTGPYAFSFEILAEGDIAVYFNAAILTLTTDYTVTINANGTGSVTIVTGTNVPSTPTASDQITIVGSRDIERTTDFVTAGDFRASAINEQLDSQIIMIQQIAEENQRGMRAPPYDPALVADGGVVDMTLPTKASRAGKTLAFDSDGNPVAGEDIGNWRGDWAAATAYSVRDLVKDASNYNVYRCNTAHTSSGTTPISSNTDSAKWDLVFDASYAATQASNAAASAAAAATSESNAASSASAASTSASNAATSESNAASSASSASTSASSASSSETNAASSASAASTSASAASTSASNASTSATAAAASATAASDAAGTVNYLYTFDNTTTMADPGAGGIRLNNAASASTTAIAIDDQTADSGNPDVSLSIVTWDDSTSTNKGRIRIVEQGDPTIFAEYNLTGLTDNSGWTQLAVSYVTGNATFTNGGSVRIQFLRTGDAGDMTGPVSSTDNALVRWDGTTGNTAQNSGAILDDSNNLTGLNDIEVSGNAGIGTASPSYPLQVSSSSGAGTQVGITYVPSSVTMLLRAGGSDVNVGSVGAHPLVFKTNDTERLRVLSSGGLTFNGDTAAANALDDYEEGTFTLTLSGATTTTYTTNSGAYTKVGDIVYVRGILHINSYGDGNGGKIDGFPFAASGESALSIAKISSIQTAVVDISFRIVGSSGYFMHRTAASTVETTNPSQMAASGAYLSFAGTYKAS